MKKLSKDVLVQELLFLIAKKTMDEKKGNMSDVRYPLSELSTYLSKKFDIVYNSEQHLYNQLKKYEKEEEILLFSKVTVNNKIFIKMKKFHHFDHLIILNKNLKLMLANGVLDLLSTTLPQDTPWNIYLGDGSECYYASSLLLKRCQNNLNIYTNNLEVIHDFYKSRLPMKRINVFTRTGKIHRETCNTEEKTNEDFFLGTAFDFIIQSPRYIKKTCLYEVYEHIVSTKRDMLQKGKGKKIGLFTLFEFFLPSETLHLYGDLLSYNYLIFPPRNINEQLYEEFIDKLPLELYKSYFFYNIYKTCETKK